MRAKDNLWKFNDIQKSIIEQRFQMVTKAQIHLLTFAKSLTTDIDELCKKSMSIDKNNAYWK